MSREETERIRKEHEKAVREGRMSKEEMRADLVKREIRDDIPQVKPKERKKP